MIVILNNPDSLLLRYVTQELANRFERGAAIQLHASAQKFAEAYDRDILFDMACRQVFSEKRKGKEHVVVSDAFGTPDLLKQLRELLSRYDNEIYAFRLCLHPTVIEAVTQTAGAVNFSESYAAWEGCQAKGVLQGDMGYGIQVDSMNPESATAAIWDDIHEPIELSAYQPDWAERFNHERTQILEAMSEMNCVVEHIGSTAIPGMIAKPVLDMLLLVENFQEARRCIAPLRRVDYAFIDYPQNTTRLFFRKGKPRSHHIHIVEQDSPTAAEHLDFRDVLLRDAALRAEYLQLKQDALRQHQLRRALFGARKTDFIRKALAKYRDSAVFTGTGPV